MSWGYVLLVALSKSELGLGHVAANLLNSLGAERGRLKRTSSNK